MGVRLYFAKFMRCIKCADCRKGVPHRLRKATKEWVHNQKDGGIFSIKLCMAAHWQNVVQHLEKKQ